MIDFFENKWLNQLLLTCSYLFDYSIVSPRSACVAISKYCNSRCVYCNNWNNKDEKDISFSTLKTLFVELQNLRVREIVISGGEPLMRSDIIDIIVMARSMGFSVRVLSNGLLLTTDILKKFDEIGVTRIGISIDSLNPAIYTKVRGTDGKHILSLLNDLDGADYKVQIVLYSVLSTYNVAELETLLNFCASHNFGAYFQALECDRNNQCIRDDIKLIWPKSEQILHIRKICDKIISNREKYNFVVTSDEYLHGLADYYNLQTATPPKCYAGYTRINIDKHLNVLPCWQLEPVGNIQNDSIRDIWKSKKMNEARSRIRKLDCPGCWFPCHIETSYTKGTRT